MENTQLTQQFIGLAIEVHKTLGAGWPESSYACCLMYKLISHNIEVQQQVALPIQYKGVRINGGYRVDTLVPNKLIIELKVIDKIQPIHIAQTLTYMKLSNIHTGLIINFNTPKPIKVRFENLNSKGHGFNINWFQMN